MKKKAPIIHKRVTSNKLCESFDYQLCAAIRFNDKTTPEGEWKRDAKCHWRFVTCDICKSMRGLKREKTD